MLQKMQNHGIQHRVPKLENPNYLTSNTAMVQFLKNSKLRYSENLLR